MKETTRDQFKLSVHHHFFSFLPTPYPMASRPLHPPRSRDFHATICPLNLMLPLEMTDRVPECVDGEVPHYVRDWETSLGGIEPGKVNPPQGCRNKLNVTLIKVRVQSRCIHIHAWRKQDFPFCRRRQRRGVSGRISNMNRHMIFKHSSSGTVIERSPPHLVRWPLLPSEGQQRDSTWGGTRQNRT